MGVVRTAIGKLPFVRRTKHLLGLRSILLPHQDLKACSRPSEVFAHSSRGVGLHHGVDTSRVQRGLCDIGFSMATKRSDDYKFRVSHSYKYTATSTPRPPRARPIARQASLAKHREGGR